MVRLVMLTFSTAVFCSSCCDNLLVLVCHVNGWQSRWDGARLCLLSCKTEPIGTNTHEYYEYLVRFELFGTWG